MVVRGFWLLGLLALLVVFASCGGAAVSTQSPPTPTPSPTPSPTATPPAQAPVGHIVVLLEENHSYSDVIGNPDMPYLNSLASQYSLATQYYADAHPSIGNYFMLTTGQLVTIDDSFSGTVDVDNLVRRFSAMGKSWKSYAESLPNVGYVGGDAGLYLKHHNPFSYFTDVVNNPAQAANLVPFTQFAADLAANALPTFSFVVPNADDDAHDGTLAAADSWLQANISPLLASTQFQKDGLLIIVFDESELTDLTHIGGHVPAVLVGPDVKKGYQSVTFYQHESTLRFILKLLGASTFPGNAANAPDMSELLIQ